jgi:hypothetical protein
MSNAYSLLSTGNTFGDWIVTTNALTRENNDFHANSYHKNAGTLYLDDATLGLQVNNQAIFAGAFQVTGTGSSATIQNNLTVQTGQVYFQNTEISLVASGNVTAPNVISTNVTASGNIFSSNVFVTKNVTTSNIVATGSVYVTTNVNAANIVSTNVTASGNIFSSNSFTTSNVTTSNVVATGSVYVTNNVTTSNVVASNVYVSSNITTSNVVATGGVYVTSNINAANIVSTNVTASGNVISSNVFVTSNITTSNVVATGSVYVTTNVNAANIVSTNVSASGNVISSNVFVTKNVTTSNIVATGSVYVTNNVTTSNIVATGSVYVTSNINAANIVSTDTFSSNSYVTSNITTSNVVATGSVYVTNNVTTSNVVATGNVWVSSNVQAANVVASKLHISGTTRLVGQANTTADLGIGGNLYVPNNLIMDQSPASASIYAVTVGNGGLTVQGNFTIATPTVYQAPSFTLYGTTPITGGNFGQFNVNRLPGTNASIRWSETNKEWAVANVVSGTFYRIVTDEYSSNSSSSANSMTYPTSYALANANTFLQTTITTANTGMASYVVASVVASNTAMKSYVDQANTGLKSYGDDTYFAKAGGNITGTTNVQSTLFVTSTLSANGGIKIGSTTIANSAGYWTGPTAPGFQGPQGVQGVVGAQGSPGSQGPTGTAGAQGVIGPQGAQGVTGTQGQTGFQGATGAQGPTGPQGAQGSTGSPGSQGPTGTPGAQGPQGFQGATGPQGAQGTNGFNGTQGATGPQGATGAGGAQGPTGPQGLSSGASLTLSGGLGVGTPAGATGEIRATADITAYYSSDKKFKENIKDIPNALGIVNEIGGKLFDWTQEYIDDHGGVDEYFMRKEDFGVIAQDVQRVFPIAVRTRQNGTLAVDYEKLCALAFAAIKELKSEVDELKKK